MKLKNSILLFLTATIWGFAFVAQSVCLDYIGPYTMNCIRFLIGGFVLIPCIFLLQKLGLSQKKTYSKEERKTVVIGGICCGIALCTASSLQQIGIMYTSVGKAGFITTFYIIFVPLLGLFFHKHCGWNIWIGVILALIGLYLLCFNEKFSIGKGDLFILLCAFVFSIHILIIDYFSPLVDGVLLSCIQFFVSSIICSVPMFLFEHPSLLQIIAAWQPILYAGIMSCGVAYTLQIIAQKGMNPTIASLILSLESVMSVVGGMLVLHQMLSARELLGCLFMFIAIILAQLPFSSSLDL